MIMLMKTPNSKLVYC